MFSLRYTRKSTCCFIGGKTRAPLETFRLINVFFSARHWSSCISPASWSSLSSTRIPTETKSVATAAACGDEIRDYRNWITI
jgi:hypothetical protein